MASYTSCGKSETVQTFYKCSQFIVRPCEAVVILTIRDDGGCQQIVKQYPQWHPVDCAADWETIGNSPCRIVLDSQMMPNDKEVLAAAHVSTLPGIPYSCADYAPMESNRSS